MLYLQRAYTSSESLGSYNRLHKFLLPSITCLQSKKVLKDVRYGFPRALSRVNILLVGL